MVVRNVKEITALKHLPNKIEWLDTPENVHAVFRYENDYGASVILNIGSFGHDRGLFELGVIYFPSKSSNVWELTYNTPITNDVIGYLNIDDVVMILDKIKAL
jgi:hypothetical protein